MPELPEVAFFKSVFEKHALGRKTASARVTDARIVRGLPAGELERELSARKFLSCRQHGKYLFAETDAKSWLVMHFGMTGYVHYSEKPEECPKYGRLVIDFENDGTLTYVNQRMFGWIGMTAGPDELIARKGLGPSALDPRLDYGVFLKIISARKGAIKPALLDQGLIAGIGNLYADEILFQAGIHPKESIGDLGEPELKKVFEKMGETLRTAVARNAGALEFPDHYLFENRRKGGPCPVCGNKLETARAGGRTSYFCPNCQKKS